MLIEKLKMKQTLTRDKKLLGKGVFSRVYANVDGTVTILTQDNTKECLALFCRKMKHLPDTTLLEVGVYKQPRYHKIPAVNQLKEWKVLKNIQKEYNSLSDRNYNALIDLIERYKNELGNDLYEALEELISAYSNYEYNIGFEIARRNLAVDNDGNLVLLDIIYSPELLNKKRGKK